MKQLFQRVLLALLGIGVSALTAQAQGPTLDPSFAIMSAVGTGPPLAPSIFAMVQQPDGKIILGGDLAVLNGIPVNGLCRLLPNGQVDASFAAAPISNRVFGLFLQADGKLLIAGNFTSVGGQPRFGLARLLPNGTLDAGFVPPLGRTPVFSSTVYSVILQPGVGIIISGDLALPVGTPLSSTVRLTEATGALDPTFAATNGIDIADVLPLPNGNLVFAGVRNIGGLGYTVWGTLPDGTLDPAFVPLRSSAPANRLVRDPRTGNIYVNGALAGTGLDREPVRLLPNGVRDLTFNTAGAFVPGTASRTGNRGFIYSLAVQPNGRLLLGGDFALVPGGSSYAGSWRLLPSGARDLSYQPANGPGFSVGTVLVQPNGALLFAGKFTQASGTALNCLARMLDPNVLSANNPVQTADEIAAWPVPARDVLYLRLPAARPARQVQLLDALGRVVRRQALAPGQAAPALPTAGLAPGIYLLRVGFADGPPAYRRVTVE